MMMTQKKRILSRGYQELFQVHFCKTMFVDVANTTVPNLIYVLKKKCLLPNGVGEFHLLLSSSQ